MKHAIFAIVVLVVCERCSETWAQLNYLDKGWRRVHSTAANDFFTGVAADGLGSVYVTGASGPGSVGVNATVHKYDEEGTLQWTSSLGITEAHQPLGISADALGNIFIVGEVFRGEWTSSDAFVSKLDSGGAVQWTRRIGDVGSEAAFDVSGDGAGNLYVVGNTEAYTDYWPRSNETGGAFISKLSSAGDLLWTRLADGSKRDTFSSVIASGSDVFVAGAWKPNPALGYSPNFNSIISKYDPAGALQWTYHSTSNVDTGATDIGVDESGSLYIAGIEDSASLYRGYLQKFNGLGQLQWSKDLDVGGIGTALSMAVDRRGNSYVTGSSFGQAFVGKYNPSGELQWTREVDSHPPYLGGTLGRSTSIDVHGAVYVAGSRLSGDGIDAYVSKLGPSAEEVVRNAVQIEVLGDRIRARFSPNFEMTLDEAAEHCGVVSFNWLQTFQQPNHVRQWVVQGPIVGIESLKHRVGVDRNSGAVVAVAGDLAVVEIGSGPQIDPIIEGDSNAYVFTYREQPFDAWHVSLTDHTGSDASPLYLNDLQSANVLSATDFQTERALFFEDAPSAPDGFYLDGEYIEFTTQLVGVKHDGTFVTWKNLGTNFIWRSDRTHSSGDLGDVTYLSTPWTGVPLRLAGGVFGLSIDSASVPEPKSPFNTFCGVACLFASGAFRPCCLQNSRRLRRTRS